MNTYNVVVTVSTTVCIDAESPDDAIEKVSQALNNGDVNMSTDIANNIGYSMRNGHYEVTDATGKQFHTRLTTVATTESLTTTRCMLPVCRKKTISMHFTTSTPSFPAIWSRK